MAMNTRARSDALQEAAKTLLIAREIDVTQQVDIRALALVLKNDQGCHYDTAKRHIAKAVRIARGEMSGKWGGVRLGAGRPKEQ